MINPDLLVQYGAKQRRFAKGEMIFQAGEEASSYYQVVEGEVKMNNYNEEGKEFVQGIFSPEGSFGEPPLFGDFPYPANALVNEAATVFVLGKAKFLELLTDNPDVLLSFTKVLSQRLLYKATIAANLSIEDADKRILHLIDHLKTRIYKLKEPFSYQVDLTRKQIAELTGLRVETVIRMVKKLEEEGALKIIEHKVWR